MTALNRSTHRRLRQLRQVPSVWEGDRRPIAPDVISSLDPEADDEGECILWVDGSEGIVRAMDVVALHSGPEAIVRTLLRAMESPHNASPPARPQKIVVRDREIQFFLRGVLQDLDIAIEHVPELPLIDEIFRGLEEGADARPPDLPPQYADALLDLAQSLWQQAPWEILDEEKILAIEVNSADAETLYVSVLGMLGMEYGILLYRSIESLKLFRERVLASEESPRDLQAAFLEQDCFFLTFESAGEVIEPSFGSLHPLEGMRSVLYEEEAIAVLLALSGLQRFFQKHRSKLKDFPPLNGSYRIPHPDSSAQKVAVQVCTMPELAEELFELTVNSGFAEVEEGFEAMFAPQTPILRTDLIPEDAYFSLGAMPWEVVEAIRSIVPNYQAAASAIATQSDGFPIVLIQTSRPKALNLIKGIQQSGGLAGICFNPGEDPFAAQRYDLGILQATNGDLHLFGEFEEDDPIHVQARKKWDQRCRKTKGFCGLVIAKGLKGQSRGQPDLKDMLALFEVRSLASQDLGLGALELVPQFE